MKPLKQTFKRLLESKGYVAAFVLTLGLGIGANTAIFSVVNGVLLRPLPYPDADRILYLRQPARLAGRDNVAFSFVEIEDYRRQMTTVDELVEFGDWTFNVLGRGEPHRATGGLVTSNFFRVLGLRPLLGRTLASEDEGKGATPTVVLTYDYWRRVFGADPKVVGQILDLTVKKAVIVGVLQPGSHYASERKQDFYANYACNDHYLGAAMQDERTHRMTEVFALMKPAVSPDAVGEEFHAIMRRLHEQYPDAYPAKSGYDLDLVLWKDELTSRARPTLLALLATAGLALALACANVGNLSLTRLIQRERELAIRAALGATPSMLRRLLLGENLLLSLLGAALGLVLAGAGLQLLIAYAARFTHRTGEISMDGRVLAFTIAAAVASALFFAWLPRRLFSRDLGESLAATAGRGATGSGGRRRLQRMLVVTQLAISTVLLVGAGLLVRSLVQLYSVDPGFDLGNVLALEAPDFSQADQSRRQSFATSLIQDLAAQPEIENAAVASTAPLTGSYVVRRDFEIEGSPVEPTEVPLSVIHVVSENYFNTVGIPLLSGRAFTAGDDSQSPRVAILSRDMAEHYFPDRDPVGLRIRWKSGANWAEWNTIVGVAANTRSEGLDRQPVHTLFLPTRQNFTPSTVLVRSDREASGLSGRVVEQIRALDPNRPIDHILTLAEVRSEYLAPQRLNATLFGLFAVLALTIAGVGVAGVLAFSVTQRTRELCIRQALGAQPRKIFLMVVGEALGLTAMGLLLGAVASIGVVRFLKTLLFEVQPLDPLTFLATGLLLFFVAAAAAAGPARRATSVDPLQALRAD